MKTGIGAPVLSRLIGRLGARWHLAHATVACLSVSG